MRSVLLKRDKYVGAPLPLRERSVSTNQGERLRVHFRVQNIRVPSSWEESTSFR